MVTRYDEDMKHFKIQCEIVGDMVHADIYMGRFVNDMMTVVGNVQIQRGVEWARFVRAFPGADFIDKDNKPMILEADADVCETCGAAPAEHPARRKKNQHTKVT